MTIPTRNKKVTAGIGVAAAAAAALALGAGTYAAFSDSAQGPSGTAAAGTLYFDDTATQVAPISFSNVAPGDSATKTFSYTNGGSLPGVFELKFQVENIDEGCAGGGSGPEAEAEGGDCGTVGELGGQTYVEITPSNGSEAFVGVVDHLDFEGGNSYTYNVPVAAGETVTFDVYLEFLDDEQPLPDPRLDFILPIDNNKAQGDTVSVTGEATLTQQ